MQHNSDKTYAGIYHGMYWCKVNGVTFSRTNPLNLVTVDSTCTCTQSSDSNKTVSLEQFYVD